MAVLWAGGEIADFATITPSGSWDATNSYLVGLAAVTAEWSTSYYRPGYARGAILCRASSGAVALASPALAAPVTTCGLSCWLYASSWGSASQWVGLTHGGNRRLSLGNSGGGALQLKKFDGVTETTLATGTVAPPANIMAIAMLVESYGASAHVQVWINEVLHIDYTGDISIAGCPGYDGVYIGQTAGTSYIYVSEIILTDGDPRGLALVTLEPNAAGDVNTMDGGLYTDVDEYPLDDSDGLWSGTADQQALFNIAPLSGAVGRWVEPAGPLAVVVRARAARGAAGPQNISLGVKSGGTENWGANQALGTDYAPVTRVMAVNPVTGARFTVAGTDALQIGCQSKA